MNSLFSDNTKTPLVILSFNLDYKYMAQENILTTFEKINFKECILNLVNA